MKKLLALFLASALILGMAACGDRKQGEESSSESSSLGAAKDSIGPLIPLRLKLKKVM